MKALASFALLGTLFTANAFACGGVYIGKIQDARLLENKELTCVYNGEKSLGTLSVRVPRCMGARPEVTLEAFDEKLDVMNLNVKLIRGIVKYTYSIKIDAVQTDLKISCSADVHPKR